jgi:hypothetical protein
MVGFPFATAPTTITIGLSLLTLAANFVISISLAWVENAIFGASDGRCKVTGDLTISKRIVDDYSALIESLLSS